jgi:molybdopterin converting factor subunit 1
MPTVIEPTTATITIRLLHFAMNRELLGCAEEQMQLPAGRAAAAAWAQLVARAPKLAQSARSQMVAVNSRYATLDQPLQDGDELAFIPPVSGG